jgi:ubiquinone/menaquinone biosynthesis C-methylase UbiE
MSVEDFVGPIGNASTKYKAWNPVTRVLLDRFLRVIDETAEGIAPARVLDVGCGEGVVTERLARRLPDATIVGVDADDARLRAEWESRRLDNLSFTTGSTYDLPFDDCGFDLVCAFEVLEHLKRPPDALTEMARVSGGSLLLSVPREPHWRLSHMLAGRNLRRFGDTPSHINHWSRSSFARLVSECGHDVRVRTSFPWTVAVVDVRA